MTRGGFDLRLTELHNDLLRMGSIVEKQIHLCIEALVNHDVVLAKKIIEDDDLVDDLQKEIEDKCIKLIATEQPLAKDLRMIFTTTKIVTDLERMADHAVDIAKIAIRLKDENFIKPLVDIPKMSNLVNEMIKESLDCYVDGNVEGSYIVCKKDDQIDAIYRGVFKEMLPIMAADNSTINQATQFLFICKYLERIADHVTNICEWTIYLVTGEQIDLNE
ncbi:MULTISPECIES: phosphate signaling complex protein PhoU [unclassified Clostridium]|uniref:phosphate signaling complex protein PhoU n=1 Tax=unclassified Clostridium TaxID=2614128 RepID=UPI00052D6FCD|nr:MULTISPECIES: phosphate signaling complex protein PhoU [unclassified Clostridium]KGK88440.1 PhoU family transcriptional regulator [Clostridium sp. HMP27]